MERRHKELHAAGGIRAALEENRLVLFGQEIRSIRGDGQGHYEVLLRLRGADGTLQPPALFIPAAERYGLMGEVDRWVVRNAFQFLEQHPHMHLAINLSGLSLQDESFAGYITRMLTSHNINASHVCFEITETSAITHIGHAVAFIRDLKSWGFRFSLDDFGAGMSSFAYLKNLPVDYLKIDGVFVRDIVSDPIDRAFVETINRIGQVMGMETIAEFVESEAILRELEYIGVDYAQGFGIAKPAPLDSLVHPV
jgi:EAL domain-containing protein (putative c-di-GMP-specific phosphodiesterase class I)